MSDRIYAQTYDLLQDGISVEYRTTGRYLSAHWHDSLELIYILNGNASVFLEGEEHKLVPGEFMVIDTNQVHETQCTHSYMMVIVRIDDRLIQSLMDNRRDFRIICSRSELTKELLPHYMEICDDLKELVPLSLTQPKGYRIATHSIVLRILYRLISSFSITLLKEDLPELSSAQTRMKEIIDYINEHYREPLSMEQVAGHFGLSNEYFSRMFRKKIGIPFTQHLHQVRLQHIYHDLCATDVPILTLLEQHGFNNYKLFSRMFKEVYGDTPRAVRKRVSN